ncbi:MAG: hypothetical protein DSY46_00190 [Hydrogenimonas sp.]|nr:MAG: hypothetical protein DSY46_00190 [Hydrogenimonas sp.]
MKKASVQKKRRKRTQIVQQSPKKKEKKKLPKKEIIERNALEHIDLLQSQQAGPEVALFLQNLTEEKSQDQTQSQKPSTEDQPWYQALHFEPFEKWFSHSISYCNTLKDLLGQGLSREALKISTTITPIKYFFIGGTYVLDLNKYSNPYYQPDFSYSFGYSDWHPDTWGFSYSNYANNKLHPKEGEDRFNFEQGTWELNYKTKVDNWNLKASYKYTRATANEFLTISGSSMLFDSVLTSVAWDHYFHYSQDRLTISGKSFLYKKFFIAGSVYLYRRISRQTFLEPDYAYSFGWYDPRPFHLSIIYSNYYTPTRWWWRDEEGPKFLDGSLCLSMSIKY